jgi:hypothetical protein
VPSTTLMAVSSSVAYAGPDKPAAHRFAADLRAGELDVVTLRRAKPEPVEPDLLAAVTALRGIPNSRSARLQDPNAVGFSLPGEGLRITWPTLLRGLL